MTVVSQVNCPRRSTSLPTGEEPQTSRSRKPRCLCCCSAACGSAGSSSSSCTSVVPDVPPRGHDGNVFPVCFQSMRLFSLIIADKMLPFVLNALYLLLSFNDRPSFHPHSLKSQAISFAVINLGCQFHALIR